MTAAVLWFRRDLRLSDHPALLRALAEHDEVVPLFVLDPRLWHASGANRLAFLAGCLAELAAATGGALVVRRGQPEAVVPELAHEVDAPAVYVTAEHTPYGRARDQRVAVALGDAGRTLVEEGSSFAVPPGTLHTGSGEPYRVFTPFYRAWRDRGWAAPARRPRRPVPWRAGVPGEGPPAPPATAASLPEPGEAAARRRLDAFLAGPVERYHLERDRPALDATSRLGPYLKWGCLHPRQVLGRLSQGDGPEAFRRELAWREFCGHVLAAWPRSAWTALRPELAGIAHDAGVHADERFAAWAEGRTGYPLVDAGMRQLRAEGFMPNRVRMVAASFLVKDLHLDWTRGARHFLTHLVDGDLASNNHNWQWVAGTGTDAAPYFRVLNPLTQSRRHDPDGDYIRRWVPELAGHDGDVHQPWSSGAAPGGYPEPLVDHAAERAEAIRRYRAATSRPSAPRRRLSPGAGGRRAP